MKKRLFRKKEKGINPLFMISGVVLIYLASGWDWIFGDIVAFTPGVVLLLVLLAHSSMPSAFLFSAAFALFWAVFNPVYILASPVLFTLYSLMALLFYKLDAYKWILFLLFLTAGYITCVYFYANSDFLSMHLLQPAIILIIALHLRKLSKG